MSHGGRRHGLRASGAAQALLVRLSDEDRAVLDALVEAWTAHDGRAWARAEVVRALIRGCAKDKTPA